MSGVSFGLNVGLSTSQKLTPQMQQAIRLLQLSSLELEQEVQVKLDSNPLLERIDDGDEADKESPASEEWSNTWDIPAKPERESDGFDEPTVDDSLDKLSMAMDDTATDSDWQSVYGDDVMDGYGGAVGEEDFASEGATALCIQDHIRWQMNFKRLSDLDKLIAERLIDGMDDDGFIRVPLEEVVGSFATVLSFYELEDEIGIEEVIAVLKMIQSCNPTGVGARDLAECLLLQLKQLPFDTPYLGEARLVLLSAEHLKNNDIKKLVDETGLSTDEIKSAINLIRTLDPSPAERFVASHTTDSEYDIPDILVIAKDDNKRATTHTADIQGWRIILNPETLPRLQINQEYAALIKRGDDSAQNQYIKDSLQDARLFIRNIEERNQNLLKVATCIVQKQQAFLLEGVMSIRPLTLKEVADSVGLHESSVSRLTTNKTMSTSQGIFSLKYFFSSSVGSSDGEVSSTAICAMIAQMIDSENPKKPLSDSALTKQLEAQGIDIARRTVAKYRESMNILPSPQRKQKL